MTSALHSHQKITIFLTKLRQPLLLINDDAAYHNESVHSSTEKAGESRHIYVSIRLRLSDEIHADEKENEVNKPHGTADSGIYVGTKVVPDHVGIPSVVLGTCTLARVIFRLYRSFASAVTSRLHCGSRT